MASRRDFALPGFENAQAIEIMRRQREFQKIVRQNLNDKEREILRRHGLLQETA